MHDKRIQLNIYVSPQVAAMTRDAALALDQSQSAYVRSALVRALRTDGFDPAAPAQASGSPPSGAR
jgi:hypothetical protein